MPLFHASPLLRSRLKSRTHLVLCHFILLIGFTLSTLVCSAQPLRHSGFVTKTFGVRHRLKIKQPKNKIIIIYNHGQTALDRPLHSCNWVNSIRNWASLTGEQVDGKEIMVYLLCTNHLYGDAYKGLWRKGRPLFPYPGKTKLDKRVDAILALIARLEVQGVPSAQIFIAGFSCGGWASLMLAAQHMDKIGGTIVTNPACYGKLSKEYRVAQVGTKSALAQFNKDYPTPAALRRQQIEQIKASKFLPVLVFTHPLDAYEGSLSAWLGQIPGARHITLSSNYKVHGRSCRKQGLGWSDPIKKGHYIPLGTCFQYYNLTIKNYIAQRLRAVKK